MSAPKFKILAKDMGKLRTLARLVDKYGVDSPDDLPHILTGGGAKPMKPSHEKAFGLWDSIKSGFSSVGKAAWNIVKPFVKPIVKRGISAAADAIKARVPVASNLVDVGANLAQSAVGDGAKKRGRKPKMMLPPGAQGIQRTATL